MSSQPLGDLSAESIGLERLLLDPNNPRLSPDVPDSLSQEDLAVEMAEIFEALEVARSIAAFGFYPWEALVVVPDGDRYIVVEGNRRLTAVLGLRDPSLRSRFEDQEQWHEVAAHAGSNVPSALPCVVVPTREDATPALGYRHISGIKPWEPHRQAAFVAHLVREQGKSFAEVAVLTGQTEGWVRTAFRDFCVFEEAAKEGVDVSQAVESYSLVTVMLGKQALREHLGVRKRVDERSTPFDSKDVDRIEEVFEWVFGSGDSEPVVTDHRQIATLAKVVGNPVGLEALRNGASLEQAQQDVDVAEYDQSDIVLKELGRALNIVRSLDITEFSDDEAVRSKAEELAEAVGEMLNSLDTPGL